MAAVNSAALGNGLAAAVNPVTLPRARQGNGGRQSCNCPLRPAAVNSAQGSISAAFFAQGKGMDWRRSILLPIAAGQLCFCRRSTAQGKGMAAVNSAAHCGRRRSLPWQRNGMAAAQGQGMARRRSILLLPFPAGQSVTLPWAAYRRRSLPRARAAQRNGLAAAQGQRGGRRYAGIDGRRPVNFAALGKAMEWRRSTLLLPLPAGGRLTANSAQGNGLARAAG